MTERHNRAFKDRLYEQFARIGKAFASPRRLEIIDLLAQGERTVEGLAEQLDSSIANTSQHLQTLKAAHLVEVRRDGLYGYYRLAEDGVFGVWKAIRGLGEARLAEVDRLVESYLHDRGQLESIGISELVGRLRDESVTLLDVRPEAEYQAGHIAGAVSVPVEELENYLEQLREDTEVIAYCRGPYCLFSDEAVALLARHGFPARRLREGLPEWRAAGLPVE